MVDDATRQRDLGGAVSAKAEECRTEQRSLEELLHAQPRTFPVRLMQVMQKKVIPEGIHWIDNGSRFAVYRREVLPTLKRHFQGAKWESFVRTLNKWGFKKLTCNTRDKILIYEHPFFQRDNPGLVRHMVDCDKGSNKMFRYHWDPQRPPLDYCRPRTQAVRQMDKSLGSSYHPTKLQPASSFAKMDVANNDAPNQMPTGDNPGNSRLPPQAVGAHGGWPVNTLGPISEDLRTQFLRRQHVAASLNATNTAAMLFQARAQQELALSAWRAQSANLSLTPLMALPSVTINPVVVAVMEPPHQQLRDGLGLGRPTRRPPPCDPPDAEDERKAKGAH